MISHVNRSENYRKNSEETGYSENASPHKLSNKSDHVLIHRRRHIFAVVIDGDVGF